jgi:NAD-dependent dihydropyrimidine dehydrogenase PreA subunit
MCEWCLKHGANGKWYLNAENYLKEASKGADPVEYLEILWGNLERIYLGKLYGFSINKTIDYRLKMPIIGRIIKWVIHRKLSKEKNPNPRIAEGHFGQIIPLEEAKLIITSLADVAVRAVCPCRFTHKGIKTNTCVGFTALAEVLPRLPRFIPENGIEVLSDNLEKAENFLEIMNAEGKVHSIWWGPIPYIAALCSCEYPQCIGLRTRLDFGVNTVLKGEYVAIIDPNKCIGCKKCTSRCQFGAISFGSSINRPIIDIRRCFGCGLCKEACEEGAIQLVDRNSIPLVKGDY